MTPEDWKMVEDALSSPYGSVNLKIDGYDITIMCVVDISVNDLYNILNNEDFYDYVLVEFNNCIDYLEWNIEVLKSEIDSLTILFQALTGIIYKASSEN